MRWVSSSNQFTTTCNCDETEVSKGPPDLSTSTTPITRLPSGVKSHTRGLLPGFLLRSPASPPGRGVGSPNETLGCVVILTVSMRPAPGLITNSRPSGDQNGWPPPVTGYAAPVAGNGCTKI